MNPSGGYFSLFTVAVFNFELPTGSCFSLQCCGIYIWTHFIFSCLSLFLSSHLRDFHKCEMLVKDLYSKLGLDYRESSSEEEDLAAKPTEVIEIPDDDDDDIMSIDSGWKNSSVSYCGDEEGAGMGASWSRWGSERGAVELPISHGGPEADGSRELTWGTSALPWSAGAPQCLEFRPSGAELGIIVVHVKWWTSFAVEELQMHFLHLEVIGSKIAFFE